MPAGPLAASRPVSGLAVVALCVALVLLVASVVQTVALVQMSERLDRQAAAQQASGQEIARQRKDLDDFGKRASALEERTKGTLNSTAVARKVLPSVFRVRAGRATGTAFAFGQAPAERETLLVTNYHVVADVAKSGSKTVTLERQSESYQATIEKVDEGRDLAVLRTRQRFPRLSPARSEVEPGEPVVVVGAPLGLTDTVTTGVVSAVRDDVPGIDSRVLQFDAAINPGNSGGPVINADGLVVGVAQAKIVEENAEGLGLAIPIGEVCGELMRC